MSNMDDAIAEVEWLAEQDRKEREAVQKREEAADALAEDLMRYIDCGDVYSHRGQIHDWFRRRGDG